MEINIFVVLGIIVIHWIADFVFQDEKWALGKSKNWYDLIAHTYTYSLIWVGFAFIWMIFDINNASKIARLTLWFWPITFIAHTITDYFTSRIVSKRFAKGYYGSAIPNFGAFTIIGIDQVLHYIQLFGTYVLLNGTH
jgi:hypothetical protein